MPKLKVSEEDYDLLTDEERAGLKEYQAELEAERLAEEEEIRAAAGGEQPSQPAEEPDEDEQEEPEPDEDEPAEEEEPAVEQPAEEEPAADDEEAAEEDEEEVEEVPAAAAQPPFASAKLPDADEARIKAIDKQLDDIADKFDEGEITAKEMRDQQKALVAELDDLKDRRTMARMANQTAVSTWYNSTIPLFLAQHAEYKEGTLRHELLDVAVRKLQTASKNPTDPKILVEAHNKIIAEFGEVAGAKPKKKANGKANGHGRESPPKFANIPASDQTQVSTVNKFARLDKLNGEAYEKALARLSATDRDEYLRGA
jgi:hypothetical protein